MPADAAFCPLCGAATTSAILSDTLVGVGRGSAAISTSWELMPDRLQGALGPSYELGRLIGRGGYAEVFSVRDTRLKRELAVKVLRPDLILTEALVARFRREAEAVAALEHPAIVPVYDVGESDGICWLVMPLVRGETLKSILARERQLPVAESRRILVEAAAALQAAHAAGVVHRDIKPENLMLEGRTGRVLLMDFGIAKAMDASGDARITGTGVVIGTPQYMSPEQAMGSQTPDPRSDQYSLGVVGYQMLAGTVPFEGENVREVIARQMLEEAVPLSRWVPGIPAAVSTAIHQALRKDPRQRFASIDAFARALKGETVSPAEGGRVARDASFNIPDRKRPWTAMLAWAATLAGVVWVGSRFAASVGGSGGAGSIPSPVPPPAASAQDRPSRSTSPAERATRPASGDRIPRGAAPPPRAPTPGLASSPRSDTVSAAVPGPAAVKTCASAYAAGDWQFAFPLCRAAADTSIAARRMVGIMYAEGKGVAIDNRQASAWLVVAAEEADPEAVWLMAQRFEVGIGTDANPARAAGYYLLAANLGRREAWPLVAERYAHGNGFRKNDEEAVKWWLRSADSLGHIPSMTRLAEAYARGKGIRKDELTAQRWYFRAAEGGDPEAQYQVGMMSLKGKGAAKNVITARGWFERAAAQGHTAARLELSKLTSPGG
ncbi:MAG: serine/threonine-protein kinase [Gemmatimonadales bacterium]